MKPVRPRIEWLMPLLVTGAAVAQDSVALTPGESDALAADGPQTVRYVVDLVEISSSWGNTFAVAPILKASADSDPLFPTQILGATAVSPDQRLSLTFAPTDFANWSTPGEGVNPTENSAASNISISAFDRQFAVAVNDFNAEATNVISAVIGQNSADPLRLYVARTMAVSSRPGPAASDTATLSLGAIDADGKTHLRADAFNATDALAVAGENIVTVDAAARNSSVNILTSGGPADSGATTFVLTNDAVTLNTPIALAGSVGAPTALTLDFSGQYRPGAAAPQTSHLPATITGTRGNPSFSGEVAFGPGVTAGTGAALMVTDPLASDTSIIGLFSVSTTGTPTAEDAIGLPSPLTDGAFTTNAAGEAVFNHYLSQLCFRGPSGPVGLGAADDDPVVAATAIDPADGEFIPVATLETGGPVWSVAAFMGKPVLDGPGGSMVGTLVSDPVAALSSPAVDTWGNVYFVAAYEPTGGSAGTALIKAVRGTAGYELERILATGDMIDGANSGRTWMVDQLTLADADSVASGSLHAGAVLQPVQPGLEAGEAADPGAFGGLVVNATITYDNGGTPETYEAVLFVGPSAVPLPCEGDTNGDLAVNFEDLNNVLNDWNTAGPVGDVAPYPGGDGVVNFADLNLVLAEWGSDCQ